MKRIAFPLPQLTSNRLISLAMLIALALVVGRFSLPLIPQQLIVSLTFLVNTIIGMIGGPLWGCISLGILDIIDTLSSSGASHFIIWWTLIEALQGFFYGLFFYGKSLSWSSKKDWLYVSIATVVIMLIGTFIFTPLLIQIYFGVPFWAQYLAGRWLKIFEIPLRIILTMLLIPRLQKIPELAKLANL